MSNTVYLILVYTAYFISSVLISFIVNNLFLNFASSLGIRNPDDKIIRWSPKVKPALGGISFYLIFLMSLSVYPVLFEQNQALFNKKLLGILAASTLAFLMGLSDDAYNTKPLLKLFVQIGCALILISTGTYISIFTDTIVNYGMTIFWIIGLMNSINMLDNMDGITASVSVTILISALFIVFVNHDFYNVNILLLIGVAGALIGFLYFNWHPSKMFMGDTGSQFLGLFLGAMGIIYFWNTPDVNGELIQSKQFFVTILTFAIPIIDTTTVTINRLARGSSPFIGGKDHTTHFLFYSGLTEKRIAILYIGICLVSMFFNILIIKYIKDWGYLHITLFSIYFIALFWFLYSPTQKFKKKNNA
ncbi:MAG: undecaprenyl/decaprenyl-phosphate alpha-N-acetylglucosaminyl 1-phosphate transferase [Bacteroidia bacterium]|nr:undecaprenyl/decaprenyl-phosphate alpha-N-acetylglucosaminyl 1-phosphate transferase [Bacteroidia bacterium]